MFKCLHPKTNGGSVLYEMEKTFLTYEGEAKSELVPGRSRGLVLAGCWGAR